MSKQTPAELAADLEAINADWTETAVIETCQEAAAMIREQAAEIERLRGDLYSNVSEWQERAERAEAALKGESNGKPDDND